MKENAINAKITGTTLGKEDHGIPSFMIHLDFGGSGQGFGGYDLRHSGHQTLIFEIMDAVGVSKWEDLPGSYCRVIRRDGLIKAIGHIVEDTWVDMDEREKD